MTRSNFFEDLINEFEPCPDFFSFLSYEFLLTPSAPSLEKKRDLLGVFLIEDLSGWFVGVGVFGWGCGGFIYRGDPSSQTHVFL